MFSTLTHLAIGQNNTAHEAEAALRRVLTKLKAIQRVRYDYYREVNYVSEQYRNELQGSLFLDFQVPQNSTGFRFQIDSDAYRQVYCGR